MDFRFGLAVLLCLLGLANGMSPFANCKSTKGPPPPEVVIENCTAGICILKKGHSYSINVTFTSDVESNTSKAKVYGMIEGVPIPFSIDPDDGCQCGISCPIKKNHKYTYNTRLPVKTTYPSISLEVKWKLIDDHKNDIFCIVFPVKLVS